MRWRRYRGAVASMTIAVVASCARGASRPVVGTVAGPSYEFRNGRWFDGRLFRPATRYTVAGRLSDRRPAAVDSVIDLAGAYVVAAFGEDHNQNAVPSDTGIAHRYLHDGIFYVKNPDNLPQEKAYAAGRFSVPTSIDVTFANGGLTGPGGHPIELVQRNLARGTRKPGFRPEGKGLAGYRKLDRYRLTASDARRAAERHVTVATTVSEVVEILKPMRGGAGTDAAMARDVWSMLGNNLRLLRDAGVNVVIGSDRYRTTSLPEVMGVRELGVFSDTALLRMWSIATPRAVFPERTFGTAPGDEASFLVLSGNPLDDFSAVERIRMRVKQGVILP